LNVNLKLLDDEVAKHTRKARRGRRSTVNSEDEAQGTEKEVTYERTRRNQDVILPEVSVAAAWVVVMKLAYGLDGEDR
jgi:RNA polymerase I-specific transcription initiation factor RRN7